MPIDFDKKTLWQEANTNCVWYCNLKPKCDICGKESDKVIELKINENDEGTCVCVFENRDCLRLAMNILFEQNPNIEYLWARSIEYKPVAKMIKNSIKQREPVGLSKRYAVMKRDGFQCVLCGATGVDAKLEIDHIVPVTAYGSNDIDNLRTLCFKCNRGKRDQIE